MQETTLYESQRRQKRSWRITYCYLLAQPRWVRTSYLLSGARISGFNGASIWEMMEDASRAPSALSKTQATGLASWHTHLPVFLLQAHQAAFLREESLEQVPCKVLRFFNATGEMTSDVWLDAQTGLVKKRGVFRKNARGETRQETLYFDDYQEEMGIPFPRLRYRLEVGPMMERVTGLSLNVEKTADYFEEWPRASLPERLLPVAQRRGP